VIARSCWYRGRCAKGLLYLLIIGIVVFLGPFFWARCGCGGDREAPAR